MLSEIGPRHRAQGRIRQIDQLVLSHQVARRGDNDACEARALSGVEISLFFVQLALQLSAGDRELRSGALRILCHRVTP